MKRQYSQSLFLYNKKFTLSPKEIGLSAYFNIQYDRYSELMKKHKYIYHVILLDTFKVSNFKNYFDLQRYAYKDYFSKNKKIRRKDCVFQTILEVRQKRKFIPDISMYKLIIKSKADLENELGIKIGSAVCIMPGSKGIFPIIQPVQPYFYENREYVFVEDYDQALDMIQKLNELPNENIEGLHELINTLT